MLRVSFSPFPEYCFVVYDQSSDSSILICYGCQFVHMSWATHLSFWTCGPHTSTHHHSGKGLNGDGWTFIEGQPVGQGQTLSNPCDKSFCNPSHFGNKTEVFAVRFRRTDLKANSELFFPMIWDKANHDIPAVNRTEFYQTLCRACHQNAAPNDDLRLYPNATRGSHTVAPALGTWCRPFCLPVSYIQHCCGSRPKHVNYMHIYIYICIQRERE